LGRLCKESVQVRGSVWFFLTTTACHLSTAAGGRSSIRNPRTRHAAGTGTHLTWSTIRHNTEIHMELSTTREATRC
jgi:hypothetical protein